MKSLYIHIPFCKKKCLYCSFAVVANQEHLIDAYLDCLEKESLQYAGEKIKTIYIGGGTPSRLSILQLKRLGSIVKKYFRYPSNSEFTIEINPDDLDKEKAEALLELGINRVGLGAQTFHDKYLKVLGRTHNSQQIFNAVDVLQKKKFKNISVDLMYAFPNQTMIEIKNDIKALLKMKSDHVSIYSLTVEKESRFYVDKIAPLAADTQAEFYPVICGLLKKAGLLQYEVSNFARVGKESRHNINYWEGGDYIGLGVGAHSHHSGKRSWNTSRLREYIRCMNNKSDPQIGHEVLSPLERFKESLLFGLRMNQGVDIQVLEERFKCYLSDQDNKVIKDMIDNKLLKYSAHQRLCATNRGRLLLDEISAHLI